MASQIYDYNLITPFTTKDAGFSRWAFAEKDGHEYFIKEFLKPVFPSPEDNLSPELEKRRRDRCTEFYKKRRAFYEELRQCRTGNNIIAEEFFRYGTKYYIVTDKVKKSKISIDEVASLSDDKKRVLFRSILYSVRELHNHGIVHADIKPNNILLKRTRNGYLTAKIIDFDSSFLAAEIPDEINGDFVYLAPETFVRMRKEAAEIKGKVDVFALGLLFHQYYTGELPRFEDDCTYAFEAVLNGHEIELSDKLPKDMKELIGAMLIANPDERVSSSEAFDMLCGEKHEDPVFNPDPDPAEKPVTGVINKRPDRPKGLMEI